MPLSPEEQIMLQALLEKAKTAHGPELGSDAFSDGGFSMISSQEHVGVMSDGSKRRDDSVPIGVVAKKYGVSSGVEAVNPSEPALSPYVPSVLLTSAMGPKIPEVNGVQLHLPPNVPDLDTWGRTVITWGKYKSENICYRELFERKDERAVTYKNWCRQRVKTAEGHLLDFTRFLLMADFSCQSSKEEQGPIIPGTTEVRQYK